MTPGMPPRRESEKRSGRRPVTPRRIPRPPTRKIGDRDSSKKEPMKVILNAETTPTSPTQMMPRDRMVKGAPPRTPGQAPPPKRIPLTREQVRVGQVLIAEGPITSDLVRKQIEEAGLQNSLLAKAVAASGHAPETELITMLLTGYRIPKVKLANYRIPEEALSAIPAAMARKYKIIPLGKIGQIVCLAVGGIFDLDVRAVDEIRKETGCYVKIFQSTAEDVQGALKRFYPAPRKRETAAAVPVTPDIIEKMSSESIPYEDTAEYWEELYTTEGPLKAARIEE